MSKIFSFTFGDFKCTILQDSEDTQSAEQLVGHIPEDERIEAFASSPYDPDAITLSMNILLLERDGQRILFDTGNSANDSRGTMLFSALDEAGVALESIDIVALTHAHADHYSGMLDAEGKQRFPNAEYVIWQKEWDFYSSDERMAHERERGQERHDFIQHYFCGLAPYIRCLNEADNELVEGIQAFPAYGHTRHHVRYEITSQGQTLHVIGDAFLHPINLNHPNWAFPFEYDGETANATRRELRDSLGDELVLVYHFPFPGLGHIVRDDGTYDWKEFDANSHFR